jgi:A/G-specific adenine glycosylase
LLRWFDRVQRDLSWRRRRDPYSILVSEIMLQQTRAEVVERYYESFLASFPDVRALAAAAEAEVLARWSGLGYYRRARLLHHAAREVARRGTWPRTASALRALPGVGRYTAAAVASICFGERVLALDGNAERVLARRLALGSDPRRAAGRLALERAGLALLDPARPGDSNQALMELGATLCRPRSPRCGECPLAEGCAAQAGGGDAERFPVRGPRRRRVAVLWVAAVVERAGRVLMVRRPAVEGLMDGLWSLPTIEVEAVATARPRGRARRVRRRISDADLAERFARVYGGSWRVEGERAQTRHAVTYRDVELVVVEATLESSSDELAEAERTAFLATADLEPGAGSVVPTTALASKALGALARARAGSRSTGGRPKRAGGP